MNRLFRGLLFATVTASLAIMIACGGTNNGNGNNSTKTVSVTLAPGATQTLDQAATLSVTAAVANDTGAEGVTWALSPATGEGTLSNSSATAVTYTAPATVAAPASVTLKATSVASTMATASLTINLVAPPALSGTLPAGTAGAAYSANVTVSGGVAPFTWALGASSAPDGLALGSSTNSTDTIAGTPTAEGAATFVITVTDSKGLTATHTFVATIAPAGTSVSNVQPISVNTGPATGPPNNLNYVDGAFTSLTVCSPGSLTNCQTITDILVDTGSSGLRILSSALTIALPQQTGSGGNPVVECLPFVDGTTWGPVQTADLTIAGEKAASLPIQVIGSSTFPIVPAGCTAYGPSEDDLQSLDANGILGIGTEVQDCGSACATTGSSNPGLYYSCPSSGCVITSESLAKQVLNPVTLFATDNNGVVMELPAVTGAEATVSGSLIFGIGTQSDNDLGSATVYTIDPNTGNFTTTYAGVTYTEDSFLDTGSNAIYFLDAAVTGIPTCNDYTFWYCPASTQNLSAANQGVNGATGTVNFVVGNADTLLTGNNAAINGLAGPDSGQFDWGLPFFFGRKVYTAIEGKTTPAGVGPYWAY
ncbi:MAG: DUF3443 family protein [Candidatus Acidiferrales bacterium]